MKPTLVVIAGSLFISSLAVAQPEEPIGDPDGQPVVREDPPVDPPPPPPRPVVVREQPPAPPGPARPPGFSVGIGFGYRLPTEVDLPNSHWNLSMTATNPLVSLISQTGETVGADVDVTRRQLGLIFSPRVALMLHVHI